MVTIIFGPKSTQKKKMYHFCPFAKDGREKINELQAIIFDEEFANVIDPLAVRLGFQRLMTESSTRRHKNLTPKFNGFCALKKRPIFSAIVHATAFSYRPYAFSYRPYGF